MTPMTSAPMGKSLISVPRPRTRPAKSHPSPFGYASAGKRKILSRRDGGAGHYRLGARVRSSRRERKAHGKFLSWTSTGFRAAVTTWTRISCGFKSAGCPRTSDPSSGQLPGRTGTLRRACTAVMWHTLGGVCCRSERVSGNGGLACDHARKAGARSGEVMVWLAAAGLLVERAC